MRKRIIKAVWFSSRGRKGVVPKLVPNRTLLNFFTIKLL
jgi:hypothetical protein